MCWCTTRAESSAEYIKDTIDLLKEQMFVKTFLLYSDVVWQETHAPHKHAINVACVVILTMVNLKVV